MAATTNGLQEPEVLAGKTGTTLHRAQIWKEAPLYQDPEVLKTLWMIQISEITLSIDAENYAGIKIQAGACIKRKWQYHIHTVSAYITYSKCSSYNTYYSRNNNNISIYKV